jgi:ATP-dependent Clp protease ATP-binding subunit ClpA
VREIVHKALATVRRSLLAERKIRLEWNEEVMQALMDANAHTESGGSQMVASTVATLQELMRGPIMRASRLLTRVIESLRTEARTRNIAASFDRNDPQTFKDTDTIQVNVQGVDQAKTQEFRSMVADKAPDWILTPVNATDYRLNMKASALILSAPERRILCEVA